MKGEKKEMGGWFLSFLGLVCGTKEKSDAVEHIAKQEENRREGIIWQSKMQIKIQKFSFIIFHTPSST
jgi:hypothetical protein